MAVSRLTASQWRSARELFVAALDMAPADRQDFVIATSPEREVADEVLRLLRLNDAASDFLVSPVLLRATGRRDMFASDEVIANRFVVRSLLGRGGMGEVYAAEDQLLSETVALKVMRPAQSNAEALAARFRQEVQLARRVTHPGICRVHDVTFHQPQDGVTLLVLTMELLEGETLARRLSRGPVTRSETQTIAGQLADALDAAHARDIVHGDIKPENVHLATHPDGRVRVVLTDFGLARTFGQDHSGDDESGPRFGTPAYMAPELFEGQPPTVRSDLYAFALVIHRMLSVEPGTPGTDSRSVAEDEQAGASRKGLDGLDGRTRRVLRRALDPSPERRWPTARALVDAFPGSDAQRRRRASIAAAASIALVMTVALALLLRGFRSSQQPDLGLAPQVLLTATVNDTEDPTLGGITEVFRSQLGQSTRFEPIGPDRIPVILNLMRRSTAGPITPATAREVALREGASLVIYSRVARTGPRYTFDVRLEQVGSTPADIRLARDARFSAADRSDLFTAVRQATTWVRRTSGEPARALADHDRPPSDTTTSSWEALRVFSRALESHGRGDLSEAAVFLQEAVRLDPEFATAHMRLGDVLISLRRDQEGYDAWRRAVFLGDQRQLTGREQLRLRGQYLEDIGDLEKAEHAYRVYAAMYPNDSVAAFLVGSILRDRGQHDEAITWLARAERLRPKTPAPYVHSANTLVELERIDEARASGERLRSVGQTDWAEWVQALTAFSKSDVASGLASLEQLGRSIDPAWISRASTLRASFLAEVGDLTEAMRLLEQGIAFDASHGLRNRQSVKWLHLADLRRKTGSLADSAIAIERATAVSSDVRTVTLAGVLWCRLGRLSDADQSLAQLNAHPDIPKVHRAKARLTGEIAWARGRHREALDDLTRAAAGARVQHESLFLVPALEQAGRPQEALQILADWAAHPARFYDAPEPELPGRWAETVRDYITALQRAGQHAAAASWRQRLHDFEQPSRSFRSSGRKGA